MKKMSYQKRKEGYEKIYNKQVKAESLISNLRLLVFITGVSSIILLTYLKLYYLSSALLVSTVTVFVYLVICHNKLLSQKNITSSLIKVNNNSEKRINGEWKAFEDAGSEFSDINHAYTFDLDIFGKGSLFQKINVTNTYLGRQKLFNMLSCPLKDKLEIVSRQEAVAELAAKIVFRQHFEAEGTIIKSEIKSPNLLIEWAESTNNFYLNKKVIMFFRLFPSITVLSMFLSFAAGLIPAAIPVVLLIISVIIFKINSEKRSKMLDSVGFYKDSIKNYANLLKELESRNFNSKYINDLKKKLYNTSGESSSRQISRLSKIVDSISNRYNVYYLIFNILTLWDYQCLISLEKWKHNSGCFLRNWLEVIGEIEAVSSLSTMTYDNPDWAFPTITDEHLTFNAVSMGHPLLEKNRVCNNLEYKDSVNVILVTGSNMSGKSTFLRTAGINLLLALTGASVCAEKFSCSIMDIYTCMRVSDNLEENISSFYAELLRIKRIVNETEHNKQVFFLLDEIFKGTNSIDRHSGAKVLINKLSKSKSLGIVSTHDLELGELEAQNPRIKNYHFKEYYDNGKIQFDYRLQNGISNTRNAVYLMKMAGIYFD